MCALTNIVPPQTTRLDYDEYNQIIQEFYEHIARPAAARTGARVTLTEDAAEIERWMTPETANRLHEFSVAANKGVLHPLDVQRWYRFLVAAHRERSSLDASTLRRWLEEHEGWPVEQAWTLAGQYEAARSLLSFYDSAR